MYHHDKVKSLSQVVLVIDFFLANPSQSDGDDKMKCFQEKKKTYLPRRRMRALPGRLACLGPP